MSIAEQEAELKYPYLADTDFYESPEPGSLSATESRTAYIAGRTAEPTEAEIEAMARLEAQEENEDGFGEPWDCMVEEDQNAFRATAKRMLLAARKAVAE
jgi:hypothetical protein